jgi:hypothetical protein
LSVFGFMGALLSPDEAVAAIEMELDHEIAVQDLSAVDGRAILIDQYLIPKCDFGPSEINYVRNREFRACPFHRNAHS